jgi:hypothetical protein
MTRHRSNVLGESESGLSGDDAGHVRVCCLDTVDMIYSTTTLSESDSQG